MEVEVVEKGLVCPAKETPKHGIWLSNLDLVQVGNNTPTVLVYQPHGSDVDFFAVDKIKSAMSEALVPFYCLAGRLVVGTDGRHELRCTAEGVYYVVARCATTLDEFGDFTPSPRTRDLLVPSAKTGQPHGVLFMFQLTFFKCGGVCLGTWINHCAADGLSTLCFINTWANIARGAEGDVNVFFDRKVLRARSPPTVTYDHVEYQLKPRAQRENSATEVAKLKISRDQLASLKNTGGRDVAGAGRNVSTFAAVMAHVWRCACKARQLEGRELTRVYMAADARGRLFPPLLAGYFGNAIVKTSVAATVDEILSNPKQFAAERIREASTLVDDEYVRSVIDYLELVEDAGSLSMGSVELWETDLWAISWLKLPVYDADFGWGRPALMGRAQLFLNGLVYILPEDGGGISVVVTLETRNMERFKELFHLELEVDECCKDSL